MPIDPDDIWRSLPASLRRAVADDLAAVLREVIDGPDNRLVAAELERRWETALCALRRAEEAIARRASQIETQSDRLDPRLRAKVVSLGQRLPELWADPSVSREHRKALLRCLIDKVVL